MLRTGFVALFRAGSRQRGVPWPFRPVLAAAVAAGLLALTALAGCGENTVGTQTLDAGATDESGSLAPESTPAEDTSGVPQTDGSTSSGSWPPEGTSDPTQPNVLVPDPTLVNLVPVPWQSATAEPAGGERVVVRFTVSGPPCQMLGRVDVVETPADVTITLLGGAEPDQDCSGPQPAIAMPAETIVTLADPLGGRPLRDGATG